MKKTTKKENFTAIAEILASVNRPDLVEVMTHEIELLDRKAENRSTTPTAAQKENAKIAEEVPNVMESGKLYRLSEIKAMIPELASASGTQRIAAICRKLEESGVLVKSVDKRVIYYSLAD